MNKNINLAMLNKREEELTKKEMVKVKSGIEPCNCNKECSDTVGYIAFREINSSNYWGNILCDCDIWSTFGIEFYG